MRLPWRRNNREHDLDNEIQSHLEMAARDRIERGETPADAARSTRREFGNVALTMEITRAQWGRRWLDDLFQDLRYAARTLRKSPGFTAVAVLTLALGIGANTAIFSVVYAVLLRPLPYANPDQLVSVFEARPQDGVAKTGCSYSNFAELRKQNDVFSELAGSQGHDLTLTGRGEPSIVNTVVVTPELFSLLEAKPLAGRTFFPQDGVEGAAPVVILSENLWRSQLGGDPNIVGSSVNLDKRPFTVIGIMPASFRFPLLAENQGIWIPLVQDPLFGSWMKRPGGHWLRVLGRLKPGVSVAQAQAEMDAIGARLAKEFPAENAGWTIRLVPLQQEVVGDVKSALLVLLGAVGLVLLIACANIASLLLTRATYRAREMAVRIALGSTRSRIVRQLLTESAMLGLLGGAAGILLAYWSVEGLRSLLPPELPQVHTIRVDGWVLGFGLLLSVAASFISGLAPALFAAGPHLQANLKEAGGRSGEGTGRVRARNFLAGAEFALAMVLLIAAGLLVRSFVALTSVRPGFDVQRVLKADISLPQFQYSTRQQWTAFSDELLERVQAQPGLRDSAVAVPLPLGQGFVNLGFAIVGNPPLPPGRAITADYVAVSPDYFHVMTIPLLRGRYFGPRDSLSSPRVAVISEALARLYFPDQDPVGKRLIFGFPPEGGVAREIVGVVGDVRDVALSQDPGPMMYVPFAQAPFWGVGLIVKSTLSPASVAAAIRQEVQNMDKDLPVTDVESMSDMVGATVAQPRFRTWLLGLFGAMALVLAAAGIFGVISYSVSCRTREIGIRMALGAQAADVFSMVLRQTLALALVSIVIGSAGALAATRVLAKFLFGVKPNDPATFAAISLLLVCTALAAGFIPARRASQVDPIVALRYE